MDRRTAAVVTVEQLQSLPVSAPAVSGAVAVVADSAAQVQLFLQSLLSCSGVGGVSRVAVLES